MDVWQLQDAKNRFSTIVEKALREGPQLVTRRGRKVVVVLSVEQYRRLTQSKVNLVDFLQSSPLREESLDLERLKDGPREVLL